MKLSVMKTLQWKPLKSTSDDSFCCNDSDNFVSDGAVTQGVCIMEQCCARKTVTVQEECCTDVISVVCPNFCIL